MPEQDTEQDNTLEIRYAGVADIPKIYRLIEHLHSETGDINLPEIEAHVLAPFITNIVVKCFCLVAVFDGIVIGSIGIMNNGCYWSGKPFMQDAWFYVHKDYRKTLAAGRMYVEAIKYVDENNAPFRFSVGTGLNTEEMNTMLTKRGFVNLGGTYWRPAANV